VKEEESHAEAQRARSIMRDEPLEQVERQIASVRAMGSPTELRGAVLSGVERELRAARWDRRLARVAAALLMLGVVMNVATGLRSVESGQVAHSRRADSRPSLVDTAIIVAEATDAATARQYARQMAAMAGRKLTDGEAAAIDAAVQRPVPRGILGNKG
jgi:hypothetical protein